MLPRPPAEPPRIATLDDCAPAFAAAVRAVLAEMKARNLPSVLWETLRTPERVTWLHGFGRKWDDGRGRVTNVADPFRGWHVYGLAADIIHVRDKWSAPRTYWDTLGTVAEAHGLTWGGRWQMQDKPHVQWGRCRTTPSPKSRTLYEAGGLPAVWEAVKAL